MKSYPVIEKPTSKKIQTIQRKSQSNVGLPDNRKSSHSGLFQMANKGKHALQLKALEGLFNSSSPIQKQGLEEEEPMQGKFDTVQKMSLEEEEPLQGKFETIQKQGPEEEELIQGKFKAIQKMDLEEEEPLQGKFDTIQKQENNTGLPDNLKSGIENLSGYAMDDVRVHYNSPKPATLQAHAYAQGTEIHLASGQEKHLTHEAWHVVQQKQGRVKPTLQMKGGVNVNDDAGLEKEADVMGGRSLNMEDIRKDIVGQRRQIKNENKFNNPNTSITTDFNSLSKFNKHNPKQLVIQRQGEENENWQLQAEEFLNSYTVVSQNDLQSEEPDLDYPQLMILTGPITGLASRAAELKASQMPQHLKALVPWSHKRKNWMRGVNAIEGATDIAWNGATLGSSSLTLGAASTGTAAIGAGYKTGFSVAKSRIRRESKSRAAVKAGSVAGSEFVQGMIPFAGSAWGIGSGVKQMVQTKNLDAIAPERKGDMAIIKILNNRIELCQYLLNDLNFFDWNSFEIQSINNTPKETSNKNETTIKLEKALEWLIRQREKSKRRFDRIDKNLNHKNQPKRG